jgi:hypothetical protein
MTVQELINELTKIEDKTRPVYHWNEYLYEPIENLDFNVSYEETKEFYGDLPEVKNIIGIE